TALTTLFDHLWSEPQPGDFLPPDVSEEAESEILWLGVDDYCWVVGPQGGYVGIILDTNPDEQIALVRAWDSEAGAYITHWWSIANIYPIDGEAPIFSSA